GSEDADSVFLKVGYGVVCDDLVAYCVSNAWGGVENLSLIPGDVGASAVQNIGAYGMEVQDVIEEVNTVEIESAAVRTFSNKDCRYGYRNSIFKNELKGKYIITSVLFRLDKKPVYRLNYHQLEKEVLKHGEVNLQNIRKTVIQIRETKLPDPKIIGNAGSFFMNPVISKEKFELLQVKYPQIPHYFVSEAEEKVPAGWLIDQCGWKGKHIGNAGVHEKQALVLVNLGGATGAEIVYLAEQIQASVKTQFGIELHQEVNYI
ncbi:MAG: UDP-N-acetylmuramate dehydrogenase, partial [Bacteroidota bacterium]|nr:UDP-N-acetylmuramate dehydrogenase [Bacteroidota bacterium]